MEKVSPRMTGGLRQVTVHCSPAVAANAEGEEIEILESTDVLPVAPEDVGLHRGHRGSEGDPQIQTFRVRC